MRRSHLGALLLAAILPALSHADAARCARSATVALGPLQVGPATGALGTPRRACARTEVGASVGASAIIDVRDFYGYLHGSLTLEGSVALAPSTELFARLELLRYDWARASLAASRLGVGYLSGGIMRQVLRRDLAGRPLQVAAYGRLLLPTAVGFDRGALPFGVEAGGTGTWKLLETLDLQAAALLFGDAAFGAGPARPRVGLRLVPGVAWWPLAFLSVVGELDLGFGHAAALDTLGLGLGLRVGGDRLAASLELRTPLAGRERTDAALLLGVTFRP